MTFYPFLFLAMLNGGLSTYRPLEGLPCEMRQMDALCQDRDLLQMPSQLDTGVRKIYLSENKLQNITGSPLNLYTSLRHLDLSSNRIGFLEPGLFSRMGSLEELNLAGNRLYQLAQSDLWLGLLPRVRTLDLSRNRLYSRMAEHLLREAPLLRHLSLAENSILEISQQTFRGCPGVVELNLQSNVVMEIEEGAFEGLAHLAKLNLSTNSLTCVAGFNLKPLHALDLSRNSIETFQSVDSQEAFNLTWLDLSGNKLLRFPALPRENKLAYLNLSQNIIRFVTGPSPGTEYSWEDEPLFPPEQDPTSNASAPQLPGLLHLDLSYNEIESLPAEFFASMAALRLLNLSKNCLTAFVAGSELVSLATLDISSNALQHLELPAHALGHLRELYLQDNRLRSLPSDTFARLPRLQLLNARSNRLRPCGWFSGLARQRLAVEEEGCVSFVDLPDLQHLDLSDNRLRSLPVHGFYRTQLVALDLSMNWGLQVDAKSLSGLDLSLERLDLHGNGMTALNVNFSLFSRLRYLNLSDNRLSWLPPWSEDCCVLEVLDLQNNSFSSLKNSKIPALEKNLRNLYLAGNPWSCCGNVWLSHMIHKATVEIPNLDLVTCQHAKSFGYGEGGEGEVNVASVRPEDCEKEDLEKMGVLALLAALLVLSLVAIGVGLFCCHRRQVFGRHYKA